MALSCVATVSNVHHLHDDGTLLTPDALGGVLGLHVGGHAILHGARDVPLHHVGAVVPAGGEEQKEEVLKCSRATVHQPRGDKLDSLTLATGKCSSNQ